jgi:hypothetical protein
MIALSLARAEAAPYLPLLERTRRSVTTLNKPKAGGMITLLLAVESGM